MTPQPDHGLLLGRGDDDHPQYYDETRLASYLSSNPPDPAAHTHLEADVTDLGSYALDTHTHSKYGALLQFVQSEATDLSLSTGQLIKQLPFGEASFDVGSYHDSANDRAVVPSGLGGLHTVGGSIQWPSYSGMGFYFYVKVNGTTQRWLARQGNVAIFSGIQGSVLLNLSAGDQVEWWVEATATASVRYQYIYTYGWIARL